MKRTFIGLFLIAMLLAVSFVTSCESAKLNSSTSVTNHKSLTPVVAKNIVAPRLEVARSGPQASSLTPTKERLQNAVSTVYILDMQAPEPRLDYLMRAGKVPLTAARTQPYGFTGLGQTRAREKI